MSGSQAGYAAVPGDRKPLRCVVVGGSLVGLSAAIALARLGFEVTVAERSPAPAADGGGGLGVDVSLLLRATGLEAQPPVLHGVDRDGTAWHLLQAWLEEHARRLDEVTILRDTSVIAAQRGGEHDSAVVFVANGVRLDADLVIGADGARSTVRAAVDPSRPDARYAGVLLWRRQHRQAHPLRSSPPKPAGRK